MSGSSVQRFELAALKAGARFRFAFAGRPLSEWFRVAEHLADGYTAVDGAPFRSYRSDTMVWAARGDVIAAARVP